MVHKPLGCMLLVTMLQVAHPLTWSIWFLMTSPVTISCWVSLSATGVQANNSPVSARVVR